MRVAWVNWGGEDSLRPELAWQAGCRDLQVNLVRQLNPVNSDGRFDRMEAGDFRHERTTVRQA